MKCLRFRDRDEAARYAAAIDCALGYPRVHQDDEPGIQRGSRVPVKAYTETHAAIWILRDGTYALAVNEADYSLVLGREVVVLDRDGNARIVVLSRECDEMDVPAEFTNLPARDGLPGWDGGSLERFRVRGLGSLADITLSPRRLTVLVGPNGSGKSSILRAMQLVANIRAGSLQRFISELGGASALLHYGPKRTPQLELEFDVRSNGFVSRYSASLAFGAGDKLFFAAETLGLEARLGESLTSSSLGTGHWESALCDADPSLIVARLMSHWLAGVTFFHFHDTSPRSALRTHARAEDDQGLHVDGRNLASYLSRLANSGDEADRKAWRRIGMLVRRVAPAVRELRPTPTTGSGTSIRLDWIDDQGERFGAHHLSDGTLRAIALITALAQPTSNLPRLLIIDEPELGLHPAAIALLAELARSVSDHTQVIFATQSTALLDHFEPEEVAVVDRVDGGSVVQQLKADDLRDWLEDYTLSEVYQKGVVGGRP